jgi:ribosome-associated translation inhibitor RaiA
MRADLLTTREDLVAFRRTINGIRQQIEYDRDYHSKTDLFDELEARLNEVVVHLDYMDDKLSEHVYAYDVTVTVTRRVYVKASDEDDAEQTAIDYAVEELSAPIDWNEEDVQAFRDEDEETTTVYDVEV